MPTTLLDFENFKIASTTWQIQDNIGIVMGKRVSIQIKINPE